MLTIVLRFRLRTSVMGRMRVLGAKMTTLDVFRCPVQFIEITAIRLKILYLPHNVRNIPTRILVTKTNHVPGAKVEPCLPRVTNSL